MQHTLRFWDRLAPAFRVASSKTKLTFYANSLVDAQIREYILLKTHSLQRIYVLLHFWAEDLNKTRIKDAKTSL